MKFNLNLEIDYNKETSTFIVTCIAPGQVRITGISATDLFIAFNRCLLSLQKHLKNL